MEHTHAAVPLAHSRCADRSPTVSWRGCQPQSGGRLETTDSENDVVKRCGDREVLAIGIKHSDPGYPIGDLVQDGRARLDLHNDERQTSGLSRFHCHTADYPVVPHTVFRQFTETLSGHASGARGVGDHPMLVGVTHAVILHLRADATSGSASVRSPGSGAVRAQLPMSVATGSRQDGVKRGFGPQNRGDVGRPCPRSWPTWRRSRL